MPRSELGQRLLVAAIGIPLVGVAAWLGGWVLGLVLALFAAGGALELYRLSEHTGARPFRVVGAATAAALVATATLVPDPVAVAPVWALLILALTLWCAGAAVFQRGPTARPLGAISATILGALLCGFGLAYPLFLRHMLPETGAPVLAPGSIGLHRVIVGNLETVPTGAAAGLTLLAFPLVLTWVSDTFAYFLGKAIGRRKLIPTVSPGKTVEGSAAGLVGCLLVGALAGGLVLNGWLGLPVGWLEGALAGGIISVVAQIGDLAESLLKREAGVKDSGTLFPGHGGILDRLDALFFSFPVGYWALVYFLSPGTLLP